MHSAAVISLWSPPRRVGALDAGQQMLDHTYAT
jgi:hypothetical protein